MPPVFLDTSALVKNYHRELGTEFVERLIHDVDSQCVISRLSLVEIESAFALKVRMGALRSDAAAIARRRLASDLARRALRVVAMTDRHFEIALGLLVRYGVDQSLRTLDALQLSVAVGLTRAGFVPLFVASDQKLCTVAAMEGLPVVNPEQVAPAI